MLPEIQSQLGGLLVKMGDVAPTIWQAVLQQQINSAHAWLTTSWIMLVIGLVLFVSTICACVTNDDCDGSAILVAVITLLFVGFSFFGIVENNLILKNPAYYAMQNLAGALKP